MDRITTHSEISAPFTVETDGGTVHYNPTRETLADLVAQHSRLNIMRVGGNFGCAPGELPDCSGNGLTIGTYVDRNASGEPAAKVFPYRLGNEAVAVEKIGGGKIAFADLPLALRLVLRPRKERETHVVTVRAHGASRNYKVTASASGLHFYRDFDDRPGKWHLEGGAPGVVAADWRAALQRHVCHG